jgi:hypothetical protein
MMGKATFIQKMFVFGGMDTQRKSATDTNWPKTDWYISFPGQGLLVPVGQPVVCTAQAVLNVRDDRKILSDFSCTLELAYANPSSPILPVQSLRDPFIDQLFKSDVSWAGIHTNQSTSTSHVRGIWMYFSSPIAFTPPSTRSMCINRKPAGGAWTQTCIDESVASSSPHVSPSSFWLRDDFFAPGDQMSSYCRVSNPGRTTEVNCDQNIFIDVPVSGGIFQPFPLNTTITSQQADYFCNGPYREYYKMTEPYYEINRANCLAGLAPFAGMGSDTTVPIVHITAPAASSTVSGTVTITATALDNVGVSGVQFKLDGANLGAEDTTAPYMMRWNAASTTIWNGTHVIAAVARDAAGNRATSTVTITVANADGFHCYFTNGIRICHNIFNESVYLAVPNANVAYNISTVRDGTTYYTVYHSEHKGAVPPEGGDSITVAVPKTGTYPAVMPAHDYRLWGNDVPASTLAWYSLDASGTRVSGPGGGGNPIVISGLSGDPYFYVFFLGVADDDRDRLRAENDWRHYLIQARTKDFASFDVRTDAGWTPFTAASVATMRPASIVDATGAVLRSNAPKALGATQGLIGSMSYVNGTYHFFYGDYAPDGVSYNIYHRTTTDLAAGTWSAPEVLFARGTDPKNRTMVRIVKAEGMNRWLVLYGCYVPGLDNTYRQDICLQYTANLAVTGTGGLGSLSLTPDFALGFSDFASRSFVQPNLLTDRWGNQTHVNDALNTGEFYWSDFNPNQCPADPRPGCPVYGGDVLRGGWNVQVL